MGNAERFDFSGPASDLEAFHDDGQRTVDLQRALLGTGQEHQDGGRYDLTARGITSDPTAEQAQANWEATVASAQEAYGQRQENVYLPQPTQGQGQDFQRLYGQSENEKGELRRALQAQMEANAQLLAQVAASRPPVTPPQFYNNPSVSQPQYSNQYANVAPQPQVSYNPPARILNKADDEMLLAGDVESVLREKVAPVFIGLQQQLDTMGAQNAHLASQLYESEKARRGITPQVETTVLQANPWISQISDPTTYLNALTAQATTMHNAALVARAQAPQVPQVHGQGQVHSPNPTLRRLTYTERGGGAENSHQATDPRQEFDRQWQEIMSTTQYGSSDRRTKLERLLATTGAKRTSGYRDPNVLMR